MFCPLLLKVNEDGSRKPTGGLSHVATDGGDDDADDDDDDGDGDDNDDDDDNG